MKKEQFEKGLLTYGADLSRWPEDVRMAAQTLLDEGTMDVQAVYREYRAMEDALDRYDVPPMKADILENVMGRIEKEAAADMVTLQRPGVRSKPSLKERMGAWVDDFFSGPNLAWGGVGVVAAMLLVFWSVNMTGPENRPFETPARYAAADEQLVESFVMALFEGYSKEIAAGEKVNDMLAQAQTEVQEERELDTLLEQVLDAQDVLAPEAEGLEEALLWLSNEG